MNNMLSEFLVMFTDNGVITSYSIHYTKLYDSSNRAGRPVPLQMRPMGQAESGFSTIHSYWVLVPQTLLLAGSTWTRISSVPLKV